MLIICSSLTPSKRAVKISLKEKYRKKIKTRC